MTTGVSVRMQGVGSASKHAATLARVHVQKRPGVAGASWCEDFVYRAGFAVGERLRRELLLYCCETNFWNGKRLSRCLRPRCYFDRWRQHANTIRPHSALGYRPPAPPGDSSGSMTSVGSAAGRGLFRNAFLRNPIKAIDHAHQY